MQVSDDAKNFLGGGEGRRVAPSRIFFRPEFVSGSALDPENIFLQASPGSQQRVSGRSGELIGEIRR